jgi:hypothetical protein
MKNDLYKEARLIGRNCFLKNTNEGYTIGLKDIEHLFDGKNNKEIIGNFQKGYFDERHNIK